MAQNTGTLVSAAIRPNDDADLIASAFSNEIKGGNHGYATIVERDAIIVERRQFGMFCAVLNNVVDPTLNGTYVLAPGVTSGMTSDNGNWVKTSIPSGTGNGGTTPLPPGVAGPLSVAVDLGIPVTDVEHLQFENDEFNVYEIIPGKAKVELNPLANPWLLLPEAKVKIYHAFGPEVGAYTVTKYLASAGGGGFQSTNNSQIWYRVIGKTAFFLINLNFYVHASVDPGTTRGVWVAIEPPTGESFLYTPPAAGYNNNGSTNHSAPLGAGGFTAVGGAQRVYFDKIVYLDNVVNTYTDAYVEFTGQATIKLN